MADNLDTPKISVVIPTYCRPQELNRLLRSLEQGSDRPDEVIVVNNATESVEVDPLKWDFALTVHNASLGGNASGARNIGARLARFEVCVFIDDDNIVDTDFIKMMRCEFLSDDVAFIGPVILKGDTDLVWSAGSTISSWTTRTRMIFEGIDYSSLPTNGHWKSDAMPDCYAVRRSVFFGLGGLDESVFPLNHEEADFGYRLRAHGYFEAVSPRAIVRHYGFTESSYPGMELIAAFERHGLWRVRSIVRGRVLLFRRHSHGAKRVTTLIFGVPSWAILSVMSLLTARVGVKQLQNILKGIFVGLFEGYSDELKPLPKPWSTEA